MSLINQNTVFVEFKHCKFTNISMLTHPEV